MNETLKVHNLSFDGEKVEITNVKTNEKSPRVYLAETFYITAKKNNVFQVKLTERGLCLRKECSNSPKEQLIQLQDIIGSRCLRSKRRAVSGSPCTCSALPGPGNLKVVDENSIDLDESDTSAYLYIYAYIMKKNRRSGGKRERTTLTLRFRSFDRYEDNNREAQKWQTAIKQMINQENPLSPVKFVEIRKMLIIINPKSGSGKARELFQQRVSPIFMEAEIPFELHVTKRANFAREFVRTKDIYSWRGIIVVGGDGIFWEVINGLLERHDWEQALKETKLGIIPCGSGNGLARSIAYLYKEPYQPKPILSSSLTVARGKIASMDLVRVETRSRIIFSFLSVGWGLISDIDIESERLRSIGHQRFTLWSVHRLISLRTYSGKVSYLRVDYEPEKADKATSTYHQTMLKHSMSCNTALDCPDCRGDGDCETCDGSFGDVLSLETSNDINGFRPRMDSWYSATSRKSTYYSVTESIYQSIVEKNSEITSLNNNSNTNTQMYGPPSSIPALTTPIPHEWVSEDGEFVMVHAAYQTHLGSDCFFAPSSKLNDGIIWLVIIRAGISRPQLLTFLLALNSGTHIPVRKNEYIEMIPVTAFRIEPIGSQGHMTVDGEKVEYGPIQGEIFPGLANVMVPNFS